MQSNVMCFLLNVILLLYTSGVAKAEDVKDELNEANNLTVHNISSQLLTLFDVNYDNERLKELTKKLEKINQYVVDHNLIGDVLTNLTMETKLNETNFYEALNENDHFSYLSMNESNNLFVKLKKKMTRDDIIKIAAERGTGSKLVQSARRMMQHDHPTHEDDEEMNDVVDKILVEAPADQPIVTATESMLWDPEIELNEMKNYHDSKTSGRRIFKGERTLIKRYPFMASVHLMGMFWCGAVLLGADLAITSASCLQLIHNNRFFRENPRVLQVRVGSNHSRIGGELIDVVEVFFHPGYVAKTSKCNLALMRLRRHLFISGKTAVKYLPLELSAGALPSTSKVLLLGWGVTKLSQKVRFEPIYLQKKILPAFPNSFCREVYGSVFDPETMFCAGTLTTGEGACDHDAGGPAIRAGRLVGIISFGPTICGYAGTPTVFTKIGAFTDWIETINETMPKNYIGKVRTTTTTESPPLEMPSRYKKHKHRGRSRSRSRLRSHTAVTDTSKAEEIETSPTATEAQTEADEQTPYSNELTTSHSEDNYETTEPETKTETENDEILSKIVTENDEILSRTETEKEEILSSIPTVLDTTIAEDYSETTQASTVTDENEEWTAVI